MQVQINCSLHVILLDAGDHQCFWKYLNDLVPNGEIWMSQEYTDSLKKVGEWRVFISGRDSQRSCLWCTPTLRSQDGGARAVQSFMTLEEIE